MSIYNELLVWSETKSYFIQDALRRIVTKIEFTEDEIDEIIMLLKKECGDTSISLNAIPLDSSHLPTVLQEDAIYPRLVSISNPLNICALYEQSELKFANTGLTTVYGNNGSGKSSYFRILRKLCWSRNSDIKLKKNVFKPSESPQKVDFMIEEGGTITNYTWDENNNYNSMLQTMYVFDEACGKVYLNNENPVIYKPSGIEALEKLIGIFGRINDKLELSIQQYNTQKPILPEKLRETSIAQRYNEIEKLEQEKIEEILQFSQVEEKKKIELERSLLADNPKQCIVDLSNRRIRICEYIKKLESIERLLDEDQISKVIKARKRYEMVKQAYSIATDELDSINTLNGVGTNPWRALWEAAKEYAHKSNLTNGKNFPSEISADTCVLCQQKLDDDAKIRMATFNEFILNDISEKLKLAEAQITAMNSDYSLIKLVPMENFSEIERYIPEIGDVYKQFVVDVERLKTEVINFINCGGDLVVSFSPITSALTNIPTQINIEIEMYRKVLQNRQPFSSELLELEAKERLFKNKTTIIQYIDELQHKKLILACQQKLNTGSISKKIGEFMETTAVNLQHSEFISHLTYFNSELANKVQIAKTKTSQGNTFQRCGFSAVNEPINGILSDGEQKIIALSNFLAECTVDNKQNTIILDDPITSLDIEYRQLFAEKIIDLSKSRQIIVFTHDLYFLRLLMDMHKTILGTECALIGIDKYDGTTGITTDEISYLSKNVQERINSIRRVLSEYDALPIHDFHGRETKLDSARKRFRMLLERSVEEILSGKAYERFSKNIHLKKGNLSNYIVTEQSDVDFLLNLFSKYSTTEHDGGIQTISQLPNKDDIVSDITAFSTWKNEFNSKLKAFKDTYTS